MKELARALCPPIVWRTLSRLRHGLAPPPRRMFGGVFTTFAEVADQQPWTQPRYYQTCRNQLRETGIHPTAQTTHALLACLLQSFPPGHTPSVLDWGGGTGLRYWTTRPALDRPVRWHVVDNPALAAISREVKGQSDELSFADALPSTQAAAFDIVIAYSSIQYVEDQHSLLETLAGYRPRYIILSRSMARDGDSYVTRQTIHGFATPSKVASLAGITATLAARGYRRDVLLPDGVDLSPMFDDDVPGHLVPGKEWLLVFRAVP